MSIKEFVKNKPYLFWYIKDPENLSADAIVEAVLNYGDWEDVQSVIQIFGMEKTASIFKEKSEQKRSNYKPKIKNYFKLYFDKHA